MSDTNPRRSRLLVRRPSSLALLAVVVASGLLAFGGFVPLKLAAQGAAPAGLQRAAFPLNNSSGGSTYGTSGWGVTSSNTTSGFAVDLSSTPNAGFAPVNAYIQATVCSGQFGAVTGAGCFWTAPASDGPYDLTVCPVAGYCVVDLNWSGTGAYTTVYHYTSGGLYNLTATLTNSTGATSTAWLLVTVVAPIFELVVSPASGGTPLTVNLTGEILGGLAPYQMTICPVPGVCYTNRSVNSSGVWTMNYTYSLRGNYSATANVTDANGVRAASAAAVSVLLAAPMVIHVVRESAPAEEPLLVAFQFTVSGGSPPYTVQWSFGDGTTGSGVNGGVTSHRFPGAGTYYPRLTVRDGVGHSSTDSVGAVVLGSTSSGAPLGGGPSAGPPAGGASVVWAAFALGVLAVALVSLSAERRWARGRTEQAAGLVYHLTQDDIDPELIARVR
jgi:hypothetical protein